MGLSEIPVLDHVETLVSSNPKWRNSLRRPFREDRRKDGEIVRKAHSGDWGFERSGRVIQATRHSEPDQASGSVCEIPSNGAHGKRGRVPGWGWPPAFCGRVSGVVRAGVADDVDGQNGGKAALHA